MYCRTMKHAYSIARKQYSCSVALLASATFVVATVWLCIATRRWTVPNSVLFLATFNPSPYPTGVDDTVMSEEDERPFADAIEAARVPPPAAAVPKIAFLFLVREEIVFEPIWRAYFAGHEGRYSLYVHTNPNFTFPRSSLFYGKEIPSRSVERLSRSLADAMRRLFAFALHDKNSHNAWFVNLCEKTIPLRPFSYTYQYLMGSKHSFVQAFQPILRYATALPHYTPSQVRKGEVWMALTRNHTAMVVADREIYTIFVRECNKLCYFDERYFQTMLHLRDPTGIANRTIMFVDWSGEHQSSPRTWDASTTNVRSLQKIASLTEDSYGQHFDTAFHRNATVHCTYNGNPGATCFLFARKFHPSALDAALSWLSRLQRSDQS